MAVFSCNLFARTANTVPVYFFFTLLYSDCKQFYLEYNDSGTGADSLFAAIAYSADSGQTFLKPVMDKSAASLFSLSPSGQLVSGGSVGDLPSGTDILSFDAQASAQADGASIPTFTEAGNQLSIQDSSLAFNLCPCTTEVSHFNPPLESEAHGYTC